MAAFLGGNVEATFGTLEEGLEQIKAQKARPLAILSEKRRPEDSYKDVPTAKEQGYDVVFGQNWSVALPPGIEPELAVWWEDKFRKVVEHQGLAGRSQGRSSSGASSTASIGSRSTSPSSRRPTGR